MVSVIDFHCDLLSFLSEDSSHHYNDPRSRCSLPLLRKGCVFLQVCALFTETDNQSFFKLKKQLDIFESLVSDKTLSIKEGIAQENDMFSLHFLLSIENASGLLVEDEPFHLFEKRLGVLLKRHRLAYIGLVWNQKNRFCGTIASSENTGLSDEGKEVLRLLDKYSIPVDLSHSSDRTVEDVFNFIDINNLKVIPIASHSNFREIWKEKRNLTREHAQEIGRRGGIVGLNLYRQFVGNSFKEYFLKHIFYAKEIFGNLDSVCFGSDFFYSLKLINFDETFNSSACFPLLEEFLSNYFPEKELHKLFYKNAMNFLCQNVLLEKF